MQPILEIDAGMTMAIHRR